MYMMSLSDLRQFTYQRRSEYPSKRDLCGGSKGNDHPDGSLSLLTPNKASLTSIPETPPSLLSTPPSSICTGSDTFRSMCVRPGGRRKRYNRLSSSSEEEEEGKFKGEHFTPRKNINSHKPVTIFSKLPASKRKKRTLEDDVDDTEEKAVDYTELTGTKESSIMHHEKIPQDERVATCVEEGEGDLKTLCEMFPQYQISSLEAVLCSNNRDLDETVSSLVGE